MKQSTSYAVFTREATQSVVRVPVHYSVLGLAADGFKVSGIEKTTDRPEQELRQLIQEKG